MPTASKNLVAEIKGTENERSITLDAVTPARKKRKTAQAKSTLPPTTPPPAQMELMIGVDYTRGIDDSPLELKPRPAEPSTTNAPLKTPGGSRKVAYSEDVGSSPSKTGMPQATTTTNRLLDEGLAHLIDVEPRLKPYIEKHHCRLFSPEGLAEAVDPFHSLSTGIIAQQVSGAAASSIKKKFIALFTPPLAEGQTPPEGFFPPPAQVAKAEISFLRTAGLSQRKAEYLKGLAEKFAGGELSARWLIEADYPEVLTKLTAVRGLGQWSVEMFACFALKRMDVFSTGDLGVQYVFLMLVCTELTVSRRGMAALIGKDVKKLKAKGGKWKYMSETDMLEIAEKFKPYRYVLDTSSIIVLALALTKAKESFYVVYMEDSRY